MHDPRFPLYHQLDDDEAQQQLHWFCTQHLSDIESLVGLSRREYGSFPSQPAKGGLAARSLIDYTNMVIDKSILELKNGSFLESILTIEDSDLLIKYKLNEKDIIDNNENCTLRFIADIHSRVVLSRAYLGKGDHDNSRRIIDETMSRLDECRHYGVDIIFLCINYVRLIRVQTFFIMSLNQSAIDETKLLIGEKANKYFNKEKFSEIYKLKGICCAELNDWQNSITALNTSISLNNNDTSCYQWLSYSYYGIGSFSKAINCCTSGIRLSQDHDAPYYYLHFVRGISYMRINKIALAGDDLLLCVSAYPDNYKFLFGFGEYNISFGRYDLAAEYFHKSQSANNELFIDDYMAVAHLGIASFGKARALYDSAKQRQRPPLYDLLFKALERACELYINPNNINDFNLICDEILIDISIEIIYKLGFDRIHGIFQKVANKRVSIIKESASLRARLEEEGHVKDVNSLEGIVGRLLNLRPNLDRALLETNIQAAVSATAAGLRLAVRAETALFPLAAPAAEIERAKAEVTATAVQKEPQKLPPTLSPDELAAFMRHAVDNQWDSESGIRPSVFIATTFEAWLGRGLSRTHITKAQKNLAAAYDTEVGRHPERRVEGLYVKPHKLPAGAPAPAPARRLRVAEMTEAQRTQKRERDRAAKARQTLKQKLTQTNQRSP